MLRGNGHAGPIGRVVTIDAHLANNALLQKGHLGFLAMDKQHIGWLQLTYQLHYALRKDGQTIYQKDGFVGGAKSTLASACALNDRLLTWHRTSSVVFLSISIFYGGEVNGAVRNRRKTWNIPVGQACSWRSYCPRCLTTVRKQTQQTSPDD